MEASRLLSTLHLIEKLKDNTRHSYTSGGRHESVAEHSWRLAMMAYLVKDEFPEADSSKLILMCLIHDLGEVFTGDIPTFLKTRKDEETEDSLLDAWVGSLPEPFRTEMRELYREMAERKTTEARIYKALDNLEAVISHNEADIRTWEPLEYELNLTYGYDKTDFSAYLTQLRDLIRQETLDKIEAEK